MPGRLWAVGGPPTTTRNHHQRPAPVIAELGDGPAHLGVSATLDEPCLSPENCCIPAVFPNVRAVGGRWRYAPPAAEVTAVPDGNVDGRDQTGAVVSGRVVPLLPRLVQGGGPACRTYKADVGGSKPSAPTSTKTPSRSWLGVFDIHF